MAAGCVVLASDTEPHREVIRHGETGLLVDAGDPEALARQALAVLDDPAAYRPLGDAAAGAGPASGTARTPACPGSPSGFNALAVAGGRLAVNVLFIHDAFPAQFGRLGLELTDAARLEVQLPGPEPLELPDADARDAPGRSSCTRCR